MASDFTYDVQMAGYDYDKYDLKGQIDYEGFIKEFRYFPWAQQLEKRNSINSGSSATLSARSEELQLDYWVSVANGEAGVLYLIGIVYPKEVERLWGLLKPKKVDWVEVYIAENNVSVEKSANLYFEGKTECLQNYLTKLELFLSQEAYK